MGPYNSWEPHLRSAGLDVLAAGPAGPADGTSGPHAGTSDSEPDDQGCCSGT